MTGRSETTVRAVRSVALIVALVLPVAACDQTTTIRHGAAGAYLAQVSVNGVNGTIFEGTPPAPGGGPSVTTPANADLITGGSVQLQITATAPFTMVAVSVPGAEGYHFVELTSPVTAATLVVTVAAILPALAFEFDVSVAGPDGVWGPASVTAVKAMQVIGGDIQVSVTWNTTADVDLHVVAPNGEEIYYGSPVSSNGGTLDLDANAACTTSSIYQENIGWRSGSAASGEYIVRVDYWDSCGEPSTDYVVTVNVRPGVPVTPITPGLRLRTFSGTFTGTGTQGGAGDGVTITRFVF